MAPRLAPTALDLFEYQAIAKGGRVVLDGAVRVIYLALCSSIRLGVAGRLWPLAAR